LPIAERQVVLGGLRLAKLMTVIFGTKAEETPFEAEVLSMTELSVESLQIAKTSVEVLPILEASVEALPMS